MGIEDRSEKNKLKMGFYYNQKQGFYYNQEKPGFYYNEKPGFYYNEKPGFCYNQKPGFYYDQGFYYNQQPGFYYNQQPGFYYNQQPGFYYDQKDGEQNFAAAWKKSELGTKVMNAAKKLASSKVAAVMIANNHKPGATENRILAQISAERIAYEAAEIFMN